MHAGPRRRAERRPSPGAAPAADGGFTLLESIVAVAVIAVTMTALATFMVNGLQSLGRQRDRQTAVRLAGDALDRARTLRGAVLTAGRGRDAVDAAWRRPAPGVARYLAGMQQAWDAKAAPGAGASAALPTTAQVSTVNGVPFRRQWYVGSCRQPAGGGACGTAAAPGDAVFYRVVAAVTWPGRGCGGACSHVATTLVSFGGDPVFNGDRTARPPAVRDPGDRTGELTVPVTVRLSATGGAPPLTWSAAGLPAGLRITSDGVISGTPTRPGTGTVVVTATDAFRLAGTASFTWTVNDVPKLTAPAAQTSAVGDTVRLPVALSGGTGPLAWKAAGLPAGLGIDAATGQITGRPAEAGGTKVTVTVTDRFGKTDSCSFTWTVR
ncbi:putative Ig domain-containing protein [Spirillospora sp. CA-253888]